MVIFWKKKYHLPKDFSWLGKKTRKSFFFFYCLSFVRELLSYILFAIFDLGYWKGWCQGYLQEYDPTLAQKPSTFTSVFLKPPKKRKDRRTGGTKKYHKSHHATPNIEHEVIPSSLTCGESRLCDLGSAIFKGSSSNHPAGIETAGSTIRWGASSSQSSLRHNAHVVRFPHVNGSILIRSALQKHWLSLQIIENMCGTSAVSIKSYVETSGGLHSSGGSKGGLKSPSVGPFVSMSYWLL